MRPFAALALALLLPSGAAAGGVSVAAAASVKPALDQVVRAFHATHPGVEVRVSSGASGALAAQIRNGAPFDLFLSADAEIPARLAADGLVEPPFAYAAGALVLWVPAGSKLAVEDGLAALAGARRVAMPDPEVAPYGRLAAAALERAGLTAAVRPKLVLGHSVAQVAQFAATGSVDAALLPLATALAPPLEGGRHAPVPGAILEHEGAVVKGARGAAEARALAAFLCGPGRAVLLRHGYTAPAR